MASETTLAQIWDELDDFNGDSAGFDRLFDDFFPNLFNSDYTSNQAGPSSFPFPRTQPNEHSTSSQTSRLAQKRPHALVVDDDPNESSSNSIEPPARRKRLRSRRGTPRPEPVGRRSLNGPLNSVAEIIIIEDDDEAVKEEGRGTTDGSTTRSVVETSDENSRSIDDDVEFLHETTRGSFSNLDQPSGSSSLSTDPQVAELFVNHGEQQLHESNPEIEDSFTHHRRRRRRHRNTPRLPRTIEPEDDEAFPFDDQSFRDQRARPPSHSRQTNASAVARAPEELRNVAANRIPHNVARPRMPRYDIPFMDRIIYARNRANSSRSRIPPGYRGSRLLWERRPDTWGLMGPFMFGAEADFFPRYHEAAFGLNPSYEDLLRISEELGPAVPRGLPPDVLAGLTKTKFTRDRLENPGSSCENREPESCTICWDAYEVGDDLVQLPCNHEYHHGCITQWLGRNATCPMCRTTIYG